MEIFGVDVAALLVGALLGFIIDEIRLIPARRKKKIRTANLLELNTFYRAGTALRNEGWHNRAQTDHTAWRAEWQDWHAKMIAKVREVDPIRAEHVDTLGTFDIRPFYGIEASQALHDLSEFTETLERLDEFILQS